MKKLKRLGGFPREIIESKIYLIRSQRVMIDRDLAALYGVETKYLNRQVRRNQVRFPREFMFRLTSEERKGLVTNWHRFRTLKHSTSLPLAFTEHGVAMLSSVLNSPRAIFVNIQIIKTFIQLRQMLLSHEELRRKVEAMEKKYDSQFKAVFDAIRGLLAPPEKPGRRIGFHAG